MGNVFSDLISATCGVIFSCCADCSIRKAKYISELEENLDALQNELQKLIEARNDLRDSVIIAEQQQRRRTDQVGGWLSRVESVEVQVRQLLEVKSQEIEKLCLGGYCSKNCMSSYKFGKKVAKLLQDVATLKGERAFEEVAKKIPEAAADEIPNELTIGLESIFDKVWRCLVEEEPGIIGLYGMAGVGKTALLTQINNKLCYTRNDFDVVIYVVVSKDLRLEKIQDTIWEKIGFIDESWKRRTLEKKALDIFKILSKKKFVLLLDDIWERVDLTKVGIPLPSSAASMVVFTTRLLDVCGHMEAKKFRVECLPEEEAWKLFQKKVGEDTLGSHTDILDLAKIVAKECGGLPLALITIGRAMSCKRTPGEWRHAIQVLRRSASEFPGVGKEVYTILKFSYDSLPNFKIRSCLLYCSLFSEDYLISKTDLIDCWIGEGFLDEDRGRGEQDEGHFIIGVLVQACLLEENTKVGCVKLHDVIRDMALWIACNVEKEKENFLVRAGVDLIEAPEIEKWEGVRRVSLMENRIENLLEFPTCPHLRTLFLDNNSLKVISSEFFGYMPSLKVLNLSMNPLTELPLGIAKLVSLSLLDLSGTEIKKLPIELQALINLKCLNLEHARDLCAIPRGLISSFSKLHVLRMFRCSVGVSDEVADDSVLSAGGKFLVEELLGLKCLNELTIHLRCIHALQSLVTSEMLQNYTTCLSLCIDHNSRLLYVSSLADLKQLYFLEIIYCKYVEELKIEHVTQQPYAFHNLQIIRIIKCSKLRDLTWIIFCPNLDELDIHSCDELEEIISVGKFGEVPAMMGSLDPFAKLGCLFLFDLPNLKSIYGKVLTFSHLWRIQVINCPKLKKLPLDFNSAKERQIEIRGRKTGAKSCNGRMKPLKLFFFLV